MDRVHRQELKHDKFVEQVGSTVEYAAGHKDQLWKWGAVALAILLLAGGAYWYTTYAAAQRDEDLRGALRIQEANVGPNSTEFVVSFPTQAEKEQATIKAFNDLAAKYPGKREGVISEYYLGVTYADQGNVLEAEKHFKLAADSGQTEYATQAKLSLADLYASSGKGGEAEKLLRSIIDNPSILVSKEQATINLGRLLGPTKPAEARKLLEPLRSERGPVSRAALSALAEIPAAR